PPSPEPFKRFYIAAFYGIDVNRQDHTQGPKISESNNVQYYYPNYNSQTPSNTWSAGGRSGYYFSKRFAVEGQIDYSFFTPPTGEAYFRFYHLVPNTLHILTSFGNVSIASDTYTMYDVSGPPSDTFRIKVWTNETYRSLDVPVSARFNVINN